MLKRVEMDEQVSLPSQLSQEVGPVILINTFHVAPEDVEALLEAWAADAAYLKSKPGFISTQLHRGIAGSCTFLNHAVWESVEAFRSAFGDPGFQAGFARYPDSGRFAAPVPKARRAGHLRRPVVVSEARAATVDEGGRE